MLAFVRGNRRFLEFVLCILIVPSFVLFGIEGYQRADDKNKIVTMDSQSITQSELDATVRNQLERMKQSLGEQYDATKMDTPETRQSILEGLVKQKVAFMEVQRSKLVGSNERLLELIKQIDGIYSDDKKFDMEAYKRFVSTQDPRGIDSFEANQRVNLGVESWSKGIQSTAYVPKQLIEQLVVGQERAITIQELLFKPDMYADKVKLDPTALQVYYKDHLKQFELPEKATIEYVLLDQDRIAKDITVSEADLKAYYESNKARFGTAEERQASHILIKVDSKASDKDLAAAKAKADELFTQVKKDPASFATVAKQHSQDVGSAEQGGDLGYFKPDAMVKPFSDATFALKQGDISTPVKSEFGWHIIQLTGIKPAETTPYETVKVDLEKELKGQHASKEFAKKIETFQNLVYQHPDDFKAVAEQLKLKIQTIENMNRDILIKAASLNQPELFNTKAAQSLFSPESIQAKKNTEAVEVSKTKYVSARLKTYTPPQTQTLEQVKAQVEALVRQDLTKKQAKTEGEARLKLLQTQPTASLEGFSPSKDVSRKTPNGITLPAFIKISTASVGKLPAFTSVQLPTGDYAVYKISALGAMPTVTDEQRKAIKDGLQRLYGDQALNGVLTVLKDRFNVKYNKTAQVSEIVTP